MDFIQNTKTNSDFNIILFSTQTKITVFTPLSDVDNFYLYRANKTQLFFIKNTLFGTRRNNKKK